MTTQALLKSGDIEINPGPKRSSAIKFCPTMPHNDEEINIKIYSLLRVDHLNNIKQGGICMCFKGSLPLIRQSDLSNMKDCLVTEINVNHEKCFFTCLYRLPSQS